MPPITLVNGHKSEVRAKAIEDILAYLTLAEDDLDKVYEFERPSDRNAAKAMRVPLTYFDGADLWMYKEFLGLTKSHERVFVRPDTEEGQRDLKSVRLKRFDMSTLTYAEGGRALAESEGKQYRFEVCRIREVPLREVRGVFHLKSGMVIEEAGGIVHTDATYWTYRGYYECIGTRWHLRTRGPFALDKPEPCDDQQNARLWMAKSMALTQEYEWRVLLGFGDQLPSIALTVDPIGAREAFRLRDIPPGASRRSALRHWVSGYMRGSGSSKPDGSIDYTEVFPYLRGAQKFSWQGLKCEVQPSLHDLDKARQYESMRKAKGTK